MLKKELIRLNQLVTDARDYAEAIIATVHEPLLVLTKDLRIKSANDAFYRIFGVSEIDTKNKLIYDLGNKQWDIPALRILLEDILPHKTSFQHFEVTHHFPHIGERIMLLNAREMNCGNYAEKLILLAIEDLTEKRYLLESEAFNRIILENSPDCVKLLDNEGRLSYMNINGQCIMEIEDFTILKNKFWWEIWDDAQQQQMIKEAVAKARNGEKSQFQAFGPTAKGKPAWWDIIVSPMERTGNLETFPQIIAISRDITAQKSQQLNEKELLTRFQNLVQQSPVAICVLRGKDYIIETINQGMFEMWDRTLEQALNKPAFEVLPELKEQGIKELLDNVYSTGERFIAEELPVNLMRNGKLESAVVKFVYEPLREADGTITGVMALAHEITEQVLARKKMEAQALMVENLFLTAPAFICTLTGPDHVYELVNERYQALFGKRKIQGKPIMLALPELEGQGFDTLLDKVYSTGEIYVGIDIPITMSKDEGLAPELQYFNFSYQPMYNEYREIYSILVFGYETTAEVNSKNKNLATEQLRAKELEEKVTQRTIELSKANELLLQKNEELVKINKELESFTYISSHDLQEPLRKIQTFANRIMEKEFAVLSDRGKDYFNRMQEAASRMRTLIEDLLAYSHHNLTNQTFEDSNLREIIEEVKNEFADIIHEKNAVIDCTRLGNARVNPVLLRQVFQNLMGNALKFSKNDIPPYIIIKSHIVAGNKILHEKLSANKNYCHISFTDNGIGFDPQYKDQVFEVFQRLHGREEYAGTGIGLAIVKKIIENHAGIITASAEPDKGAVFDIYIPA